jgi:hypothetical protein
MPYRLGPEQLYAGCPAGSFGISKHTHFYLIVSQSNAEINFRNGDGSAAFIRRGLLSEISVR